MKKTLAFICLSISIALSAQLRGEFSVGVLQSIGANEAQLISSQRQAVGVFTSTTRRFNNAGLRGRIELIKPLASRISAFLLSGFTLRINEEFWGEAYTYISFPIQGGGSYKILKNNQSALSLNGFLGINIFKIQNNLAKLQTGPIYDVELNYLFMKQGFTKSIIIKAGYEFQIDNEIFFYQPTNPFFIEEELHYKIKRNQIYFAVGLRL